MAGQVSNLLLGIILITKRAPLLSLPSLKFAGVVADKKNMGNNTDNFFEHVLPNATHLLSIEAAKIACVNDGVDIKDIATTLMSNYLNAYGHLQEGNSEALKGRAVKS